MRESWERGEKETEEHGHPMKSEATRMEPDAQSQTTNLKSGRDPSPTSRSPEREKSIAAYWSSVPSERRAISEEVLTSRM